MNNMATNISLIAEGKLSLLALGELVSSKFDIVIPKTPLYEGMVVYELKIAL